MSPHHHHHPLFPFQSLTKNVFSSFYNFFAPPPHICTGITRTCNSRPGESCDLHRELLPGRRRRGGGNEYHNPYFTPVVGSKVTLTLFQWAQPTKELSHIYSVISFYLFVCTGIFTFLDLFSPLFFWLQFNPHVSLRSLRFTVIIVYTSVVSKSKQNIEPFATTRLRAGHWVFQELRLSAGEKRLKKEQIWIQASKWGTFFFNAALQIVLYFADSSNKIPAIFLLYSNP